MQSNTDYELEFGHEEKSRLEELSHFLELKDEAWVFDCSKIRKKRSKDFYSFKCYVWPNDNSYDDSLESEVSEILDEYDDVSVSGTFVDQYGSGRVSENGLKQYEAYHSEKL